MGRNCSPVTRSPDSSDSPLRPPHLLPPHSPPSPPPGPPRGPPRVHGVSLAALQRLDGSLDPGGEKTADRGASRPGKWTEGQLHHERGNLEPRTPEKINVLGCDTRLGTRFGPDSLIRPPMEPDGRIKGNPVKIRDEPVAVIGDESHGDHWPARWAGKVWRVGRSESQKTCPGARQDP